MTTPTTSSTISTRSRKTRSGRASSFRWNLIETTFWTGVAVTVTAVGLATYATVKAVRRRRDRNIAAAPAIAVDDENKTKASASSSDSRSKIVYPSTRLAGQRVPVLWIPRRSANKDDDTKRSNNSSTDSSSDVADDGLVLRPIEVSDKPQRLALGREPQLVHFLGIYHPSHPSFVVIYFPCVHC